MVLLNSTEAIAFSVIVIQSEQVAYTRELVFEAVESVCSGAIVAGQLFSDCR